MMLLVTACQSAMVWILIEPLTLRRSGTRFLPRAWINSISLRRFRIVLGSAVCVPTRQSLHRPRFASPTAQAAEAETATGGAAVVSGVHRWVWPIIHSTVFVW